MTENTQPDQNQPAPDPIDYSNVETDATPGPEADPEYGGDTANEVVGPDDTGDSDDSADETDADGNDSDGGDDSE